MKHFKFFALLAIFVCSLSLASCGNDDEPEQELSTASIAGTYVGKVNATTAPDDEAETVYVTLTRKSSSSVDCKIQSEGWGLNMSTVTLTVEFQNGTAVLKSESGKVISGQIFGDNMNMTFATTSLTFIITAKKDI